MKAIAILTTTATILLGSLSAGAQRIKTVEGNPMILKGEQSVNVELTFENVSVGKFSSERDYITKKTAEYNAKEPGKGDAWAKSWELDKETRYKPKFIELFTINSGGIQVNSNSKYTLIFKTKSIEPGYNFAGGMMMGGRKNSEIDAEVWIVETENRDRRLAVITIDNAEGGNYFGYDYDTGLRIAEAYAMSGKKLAKYMR